MRKRTWFPPVMKTLTAIFALLSVLCFWLNDFQVAGILGGCAVTSLTFFYHFAMRLAVGALVPDHFDPQARWFRTKAWEQRLYRRIHIKKWKKHIPTYNPRSFSLEENTLAQVIAHMCQAEVVHEIIVACSFFPILLSLVWGEFWIFFLTSVAAALVDLVFVALQRSNRPRLERLLEKQSKPL